MLGKTKVSVGVVVLLVLAVLLANSLGYIHLFAVTGSSGGLTYNGCSVEQSGSYSLIPMYGYLSCEPVKFAQQSSDVVAVQTGVKISVPWWDIGQWFSSENWYDYNVKCPSDNSYTDSCVAYLSLKPGYSYADVVMASRICNDATSCNSAEENWNNINFLQTGSPTTSFNLLGGQTLQIRGRQAALNEFRAYEIHTAYGLVQYERGSKNVQSYVDCVTPTGASFVDNVVLPTYTTSNTANVAPTSGSAVLPSGSQETNNATATNNLLPMTYRVYFKDWVYGPLANFFTDPQDGQLVDCSENTMYTLSTVQVPNQGCGAFPYSVKRAVTCCPGDKNLADQTCVLDSTSLNGRWVSSANGTCLANGIKTITACDGKGGWVYIGGTTQYRKATDCSVQGNCIYITMNASCTPPSTGCSPGGLCVEDKSDPTNNKCTGGVLACGDNNGDCYDDCTYAQIPGCVPKQQATECNAKVDLDYPLGITTIGNIFPNLSGKWNCFWNSIVNGIAFWAIVIAIIVIVYLIFTRRGKSKGGNGRRRSSSPPSGPVPGYTITYT